jgi:hypothetical protein
LFAVTAGAGVVVAGAAIVSDEQQHPELAEVAAELVFLASVITFSVIES